jgi:hypothetical protein
VVAAGVDQIVELPGSVTLAASVSDDGYPSGNVTLQWSKVSGTGEVTFSNPNSANTSAGFSAAGDYQLRVTASDGALSSSDELLVTVHPVNQAPAVTAGADQTIDLPNSATLSGTATDDGYPLGSSLHITWSKVSGPGDVSFSNAGSAASTATFSLPGDYVLRLAATDGTLSASDDISVTVNPQNQAPIVDAGTAQTVEMPFAVSLSGTASDDGLPAGSALLYSWLKVGGDGDVSFSDPNASNTQATFTQAGNYTLRLTVSDGLLLSSDEVIVTVTPHNEAPVVNAGADRTVILPNVAALVGSATDDGLPSGSVLTFTWTKMAGGGSVALRQWVGCVDERLV